MCCPLVFEFSVGIGGFVIGLGQISFFFSLCYYNLLIQENCITLQEEESNSLNGNRNQVIYKLMKLYLPCTW